LSLFRWPLGGRAKSAAIGLEWLVGVVDSRWRAIL